MPSIVSHATVSGLNARSSARGSDASSVFAAAEDSLEETYDLSGERDAVEWTKTNLHYSGAYTSHFGNCRYQYLSIHIEDRRYGA